MPGGAIFSFRKELEITMEYQNNNGNYDKRNRQKAKKKKRIYYKAVCIVLCLLIAVTTFGIVNLIMDGKETPIPDQKIDKSKERSLPL